MADPAQVHQEARVHRKLDTVWRIESARLIAALARFVGDVGLAEDVAQDAFEAALRQWPRDGIPEVPAAWLTATAKHRAVDTLRRQQTLQRKASELGRDLESRQVDIDELIDESAIGDDVLRLIFVCCHPVLTVDARVSLTLRLV